MPQDPHDQLFALLLDKDAITWQNLLRELVKAENMDPWDIDVSVVSKRYIEMLKKLQTMDFSVSGKVVLAAAILLKIKSTRLLGEDLSELDRLMAPPAEEEAFYDELEQEMQHFGGQSAAGEDIAPLIPRTPQPRKRKVSIYDLIGALHKALEVKERRVLRDPPQVAMERPAKGVDIGKLIISLHERIRAWFSSHKSLTFSQLLTEQTSEHKVLTLIPLLHLANIDQRKINLVQKEPFGEIEVELT